MRFILHLLGMIAVALVVGFGLSYYAVTDGRFLGAAQRGPWVAWPQAGSPTADPYTRAHLAREGALQLGSSEGLQFVARTDSAGEPLERGCRYLVQGTTPTATFWTLAAVDPEWINIALPNGPLAVRSTALARPVDGSVTVSISRSLAPGNWLEITGDGAFQLVLTLYDTTVLSGVGTGLAELPEIVREACA